MRGYGGEGRRERQLESCRVWIYGEGKEKSTEQMGIKGVSRKKFRCLVAEVESKGEL